MNDFNKNQNREIEKAEFQSFNKDEQKSIEKSNLDLLMDIELNVRVELGRTKMSVAEILRLNKGSYIELNKLAGEPVDIFVNGKFIAKGEVVVVDEKFGVRISDIIDRKERIERLR